MYRLLDAAGEVKERRDQVRRPHYAAPELLATRPNEVWSWLLADLNDRAPAWDESVASDCIKRLGGVPSPENVQRILDLRATARWLHSDAG